MVHKVRVYGVEYIEGSWRPILPAKEPRGGALSTGTPWRSFIDLIREAAQRDSSDLGVSVFFDDVEGRTWHNVHTLQGDKLKQKETDRYD